jgi:tetratricopeptide (TPR) repeat protein
MDQAVIQQQLKEGIQAVQRGDRARGRELLLQVVAADETSEPAWLWLSRVVDDPADQLVALENALTLNPANTLARESAQALRAQLGLAEPSPPPPAPQPAEPPARQSAAAADDDWLDRDPDQCIYCGKITETEATACPFCRRSLLRAGFWEGNAAYWWLILISGIVLHFAIIQPGLVLMELVIKTGDVPAFVSGMPLFFMGMRVLLWLVTFFVIIASQNLAPGTAAAAGLLDWVIIGIGFALGWVTRNSALLYAGLDFGLLALATSTLVEKSQARVRQRTVLDRNVYGPVEFHRRGRRYAQQRKWALAALHFQRAMVLGPHFAIYYKDLSAAQARLSRYSQAKRTLRMGAEMHPDDAEFPARLAQLEDRTDDRSK